MENRETGYVFRAMNPVKDRNPLVNNGSIEELVEDPGDFSFEQMIEQLERDGGYRNLREEVYANWTRKPEWLERFTEEPAAVIIADERSVQTQGPEYGPDLYIEEVPWSQVEELIHSQQKQGTVQSALGDTGVKLTPAEDVYQEVTRQYGEGSRNIAVIED